ncbi:MAG: hypothetical protein KAQ85_01540 [Thermodesulfovibrionia bacterium]|nr:hypothetical protein [Thermodesulfovibrionia bacterium]
MATVDAEFGAAFGEQNKAPEVGVVWDDWVYKETLTPANITDKWGKLLLQSNDEVVSPILDLGDTSSKDLEIGLNLYQPGYGAYTIEWRGQAGLFDKDDDEVDGPSWGAYSAGSKTWRYMQLLITPV